MSRLPVTAAVLVGGASRRMGRPKASLRFGPESLLERQVRLLGALCDEVLVIGEGLGAAELPSAACAVSDGGHPRQGPLAGLVAALGAARHERVLLRGVDMPFCAPEAVQLLADEATEHEAVVAADREGRLQPLCAVYARTLAPVFAARLAGGDRRLTAAVRAIDPHVVDVDALAVADPGLSMLVSCNTPEEYRAALARAGY